MARPPGWKPYRTADGKVVPSVTTILSRFKEAGGLIHWAWKMGMEGLDYRDERDKAAAAGTLAHQAVDAWTHGREWTWPDVEHRPAAERAFDAFLKWAQRYHLQVTQAELRLVSETHRFGGTLDATILDGAHVLADYKSGPLYADHLVQLAGGYLILWEEHFPDKPIEAFYLLRFDKEHGDFTHREFTHVPEAKELFLTYRRAYELDQIIDKRFK